MTRYDLFTEDEVRRAQKFIAANTPEEIPTIVTDEVMERINKETGQENVQLYMAYRLQYTAAVARKLL